MMFPKAEMPATVRYSIGYATKWFVGYHPEHDEIFLYSIDSDQMVSVFRKGGLDSMGFYEYMDFSAAELLGEL